MVLYSIYRDRMEKKSEKIFAEGEAKGRAQGKAEGIALIEGYYRRKADAEARGEPFDEPYPGADDNDDADNKNGANSVDNKNGSDVD